MKRFNNLSFVLRIAAAMLLSIGLNLAWGYFIKKQLSQKEYVLDVGVYYNISGTMELLFDTGNDFNRVEQVVNIVWKGENSLQVPFNVEEGGQLKFLRLDFGNETGLSEVKLNQLLLRTGDKVLFELDKAEIARHVGLLKGVEQVGQSSGRFKINITERPFDPYIVVNPINELMYPLWQRTSFLLAPWIVLFFFPILKWMRERFKRREFDIVFVGLFLASIPLKIAWVTFTALLLLGYSLYVIAKTRKINFTPGRFAIMGLFLIPLLFMGQGEFSELLIPLGFVFFALVGSSIDFSHHLDEVKKIYTKVFFAVMSITIVSWVLLMGYKGYFYKIGFLNYFSDIKSNAHLVMDWLYYPHTTFLSYFILIGGIFCLDLFSRNMIGKVYAISYACLVIIALPILGSRLSWYLAILLSILYFIPIQQLKRILLALWAALFAGTVYFIDKLDLLRDELWKISYGQVRQNPWFGYGTGSSDTILPDHLVIEKNGTDAIIGINHSHNQFLTYMIENGALGTVLFTSLLLYVYYCYGKQNNKVMLLVIFSILLLMVVESPFKTATPLYLISFLLCCFLGSPKKEI